MNNVNVLYVEDNNDDIFLIERAISKISLNIELEILKDGGLVMPYLKNAIRLPDIILLDLKLPKRSGLEVLEDIKTTDGLKRIPIVMLTTSKNEMERNSAYDKYVNAYITKPVTPSKMKTFEDFWLKWVELPRDKS